VDAASTTETPAHGCPLLLPLVSSAISGELLTRYGSDEQCRDWLPPMASGETKVVFAITEPNAGSNSDQLATTAARDGNDYVLNGTKYYISGVDEADGANDLGPHQSTHAGVARVARRQGSRTSRPSGQNLCRPMRDSAAGCPVPRLD
jgi:alkylation response protein AidB-like acyl-CoA dehydrogenase